MGGAGFIRHMIAVTKENRRILKGEGATYSNFDKSYITDSIVNRGKKVSAKLFKKASPAYYEKLRNDLREENRKLRLKRLVLFTTIVLAIGAGSWFFLFT